jgi:hypothetical protein
MKTLKDIERLAQSDANRIGKPLIIYNLNAQGWSAPLYVIRKHTENGPHCPGYIKTVKPS